MKKIGILVGERGNWSFFHDIYADINIHYETVVHTPKTYNFPLVHGKLNRWSFSHEIRKVLQKSDLSFFEWASELLVSASHMPKICPIVARLHAFELFVWAPKVNWDYVDRVILVSKNMKEEFSIRYPDHAHKAEVVYNGVPLDKFKAEPQDNSQITLGMLCSIHPVKRVYDVVIMLFELKKKGYEPHLHIAGDRWPDGYFDDHFTAVNRIIEKLELKNNVTMHGHVTDAPNWLRTVDIFISNSYWEGQQVALLEAMASGCYCLSHIWAGADEVVPPDNLYISQNDLEQKIIEYYHMSTSERARRKTQMRTIAQEKFDSKKQHVRIREIIEEVGNGVITGKNH